MPATVLVLRGLGTLTERVVGHPTTISPFPPGFLCDRKKLNQLESILACKVSFVPIGRDLTCLIKSCYVYLVYTRL